MHNVRIQLFLYFGPNGILISSLYCYTFARSELYDDVMLVSDVYERIMIRSAYSSLHPAVLNQQPSEIG